MSIVDEGKNRLLRITSRDKINSTDTNCNFSVRLNPGAFNDGARFAIVKYVEIPNMFLNITSSTNSLKIVEDLSGGTYTATVTPGYYNITQLISALTTAIDNALPTESVTSITLNPLDGVLTFVFSGDVRFLLTGSTIAPKIGLEQETIIATDTIIMDNPVNLIGVETAYVHTRQLSDGNTVDADGILPILSYCPLGAYGDISRINFDNEITNRITYTPLGTKKNLNLIQVQIKDIDGNILVLPNNFDVTVIIKIYY